MYLCSVHYWVFCTINKGGFFEIAFVVVIVDTHLPRFEALAYILPHFDALTHVVTRVSSVFIFQTFAEVCYSVFENRSSLKSVLNLRKAYIFKSLLKVYYQFVFAESFKTFILQKFRRPLCHKGNLQSCVARRPLGHKVNLQSCVARRPLCHKVNLPRYEARRRHFIMTCDMFGTGQTNILGHMKPLSTLQRSQRQQSQRSLSLRSLESGFHMIAELFFFQRSQRS